MSGIRNNPTINNNAGRAGQTQAPRQAATNTGTALGAVTQTDRNTDRVAVNANPTGQRMEAAAAPPDLMVNRPRGDSALSWQSDLPAGKHRIFRFFGNPANPLEVETKTNAVKQYPKKAAKIEADTKEFSDLKMRRMGNEHMVSSGGTPFLSYVFDPLKLVKDGDDGKLLNLLKAVDYIAVGHAEADELITPTPVRQIQKRETEVLIFPENGNIPADQKIYPNPFKGLQGSGPNNRLTPDEIRNVWINFVDNVNNGTIQQVARPDATASGLNKTGETARREAELETVFPVRPEQRGVRWGEPAQGHAGVAAIEQRLNAQVKGGVKEDV